MQVSVENTSQLERQLTVTLPHDRVEAEVSKRLNKAARSARIDGFRPGKAPLNLIKQRYGSSIRHEVIGDLIQESYYQAITNEQLNPAGSPKIELIASEEGQDLSYAAKVEVIPEITTINFDGVELEKLVAAVEAADIDKVIDNVRQQYATWEAVERPAALKDKVEIDFKGYIDDEAFEGGSAEQVTLELGSGRMIPGFEEGLVGASQGQTIELNITFPEDYHATELAGKPVKFEVTVHQVKAAKLPELDDSFAERLNVEGKTLAALRQEIENTLQRELDKALKSNLKQQVMDKLLELNPIELPKALIDSEIEVLKEQATARFQAQFKMAQVPELPSELFVEQAKRRVSLGLLLAAVVKQHELTVDADKVRQMAETLAASYEDAAEVIAWYYADKQRLDELSSLVLEEQVVELLAAKAKMVEKPASFTEVVNPKSQNA